MLYKENRSHYYTFFLEDASLKEYGIKDETINLLRWQVTESLFKYLDKKFFSDVENNSNYSYSFKHPDVNIVLITNDEKKLDELSFFVKSVMENNQLMEIYFEAVAENKLGKKGDVAYKIFNSKLDRIYDYYILNNELSNSNSNNKKVKI